MSTLREKLLKAEHDAMNARADAHQNTVSIDDVMSAIVELGDLFAAQDDALVELAEIIEEV